MQLAKSDPLAPLSSSIAIILALTLFLCAPFQTLAQTSTSVKGHDPEYGRDLQLRLERFRTCKECPNYEIKVFADGASMFQGKDAVRLLGTWGNYLLASDIGGRDKLRFERYQAVMSHARSVVKTHTGKDMSREKRTAKETQRVVVEYFAEGKSHVLDFDLLTADKELRQLVLEIESLFHPSREAFELYAAYRPPFFSDPNALLYWSLLIRPEACVKLGSDAITVVLYRDGRIRAEGTSPLRPWPRTSADIPVVWLKKDSTEIEAIVSDVVSGMSQFSNMPRKGFKEEQYMAHFEQSWGERAFKWLYAKHGTQTLDLTTAYESPAVSKQLRGSMTELARFAQRQLPPPDPKLIEKCNNAMGDR